MKYAAESKKNGVIYFRFCLNLENLTTPKSIKGKTAAVPFEERANTKKRPDKKTSDLLPVSQNFA